MGCRMKLLKYLTLSVCAMLLVPGLVRARDDDPAGTGHTQQLPTLSAGQQSAVGILVATAPPAKLPLAIAAYGRVLDPSRLVAAAGRLDSERAAAAAAAAETARLTGLYRGANTSLKALQLAEAAQIRAQARERQAQSELLLDWGPVAGLDAARRSALIGQLAAGRQLLVRADLPGRHSLGTVPRRALVDVDGIRVPARVLGPLAATAHLQSVGLLLEIAHPPAGLGPGAEVPVTLDRGEREGRVVPDGALLYGARGVYVYHALADRTRGGDTRFAPLQVTLLQPVGGGWLVRGLHADDRIVVRGAGVLWSLQGLGQISGDAD